MDKKKEDTRFTLFNLVSFYFYLWIVLFYKYLKSIYLSSQFSAIENKFQIFHVPLYFYYTISNQFFNFSIVESSSLILKLKLKKY